MFLMLEGFQVQTSTFRNDISIHVGGKKQPAV